MNKIAKNFFSVSFSNLISQLLTFAILWYAARRLDVAGYGEFSTVQAIMVYFSLAVVFGLQTYGTREIAKNKDKISTIVGEIISLRIILFLISYFIIFIISLFCSKDIMLKNLLLLYGVTLLPTSLSIDWVFVGIERMEHNAVYTVIKTFTPFILTFFLVKSVKDINLIAIFTLLGLSIGTIYQYYIYFIKFKFKFKLILEKNKMAKYLIYGLPFVLSGILAMINTNVDRIIIRFTIGNYEAGIYAVSYTVVFFLTNVVTVIFTPILPLMVSYFHSKEMKKLCDLGDNLAKVVVMVILPISFGGVVLSKEIVMMFGKQYISAFVPFSILMIYVFLLFIREVYGYGLNAWHMEKQYLKVVTISALVNLVLNLIFTPIYGMNIAAVITVISEVINLILMKRYADKVIKINCFKYVLKALLPTIAMTIVVVTLRNLNINVVLNIIVASVVYISAIIGFKYMTITDIKSFLLRKKVV